MPPDPATLYDADVLEWSERQADLLRRLAAGSPANEAPDWPNIIEEVESVGRSEFKSVESHLFLVFLHELKCEAWPQSRDVNHWRSEIKVFRKQAKRHFTPSMRARIDLAGLFQDALDALPDTMDGHPPGPVRQACNATVDELLA